jgi:hypothetical protein
VFIDVRRCIAGGNWRIFHEMIAASRAKLYLNAPVLGIEEIDRVGKISWNVLSNEGSDIFDGVVLASPYACPMRLKLTIASFKYFDGPDSPFHSASCLHEGTCNVVRYQSTY